MKGINVFITKTFHSGSNWYLHGSTSLGTQVSNILQVLNGKTQEISYLIEGLQDFSVELRGSLLVNRECNGGADGSCSTILREKCS